MSFTGFVRDIPEIYRVPLLAIAIGIVFLFVLLLMPRERRADLAQIIQALAVVVTLAFGWAQYLQYYEGDKARKNQAVIDILRATMGSTVFGPAYHLLYDLPMDEVLDMKFQDFDEKAASLSDIFWTVGACVAADQCDPVSTRKMFCYDFKTYEFAYNYVHPKANRYQMFDDEKLDVFCDCDDKHRFSQHTPKRPLEPWPRCSRSKGGPASHAPNT